MYRIIPAREMAGDAGGRDEKTISSQDPRVGKNGGCLRQRSAEAYEISRLKMENKLLRDFLQLTGRK